MSDLRERVLEAWGSPPLDDLARARADAAIALVLEEAARVAKGDASASEYYRGRVHASAAIRALALPPEEGV